MTVVQYILKVAVSALMIVAVSEVAKRSTLWGALIASLPLTSVFAFIWLYLDTGDTAKIGSLSIGIVWLVLPSLLLFIALPFLLRHGVGFWLSLLMSCALTAIAYSGTSWLLARFAPTP